MHVPDEVAIAGGALLPGQLQPVQRGINCTVCDSADSPQAVALDEHRNDVQEERAWGAQRSEERRVGKECRSRWSPEHEKKKKTIRGVRCVQMKEYVERMA